MTTPQTPVESGDKMETMLAVLLEAHSDYVAELTAEWGVSSKARTELANVKFCGLKTAFLAELTTLRAKADDSARLDWLDGTGVHYCNRDRIDRHGARWLSFNSEQALDDNDPTGDHANIREAIDAARSAPVLARDGTNAG